MCDDQVRRPAKRQHSWTRRAATVLLTLLALLGGVPMTATAAQAEPPSTAFTATQDLDGRSSPRKEDRTHPDAYRKGDKVGVVCQTRGEEAYGSRIWDLTVEGLWVPDRYLDTNTNSWAPGVPRCVNGVAPGAAPAPPPTPPLPTSPPTSQSEPSEPAPPTLAATGRKFQAKADLDGRSSPRKEDRTHPDAYRKGDMVRVLCQALGEEAYGSRIWDLTAEGLWVPDRYVATGTSHWAEDVPRCHNGAPPGQAAPTPPPVEQTPPPVVEQTPPAVVEQTPPPVEQTPPPVEQTPPPVEQTPPPVEQTPPPVEPVKVINNGTTPWVRERIRAHDRAEWLRLIDPAEKFTSPCLSGYVGRGFLDGPDGRRYPLVVPLTRVGDGAATQDLNMDPVKPGLATLDGADPGWRTTHIVTGIENLDPPTASEKWFMRLSQAAGAIQNGPDPRLLNVLAFDDETSPFPVGLLSEAPATGNPPKPLRSMTDPLKHLQEQNEYAGNDRPRILMGGTNEVIKQLDSLAATEKWADSFARRYHIRFEQNTSGPQTRLRAILTEVMASPSLIHPGQLHLILSHGTVESDGEYSPVLVRWRGEYDRNVALGWIRPGQSMMSQGDTAGGATFSTPVIPFTERDWRTLINLKNG